MGTLSTPGLGGMLAAAAFVLLLPAQSPAQTVLDPTGDIPAGDPPYVDLSKIRVRQSASNLQIDFYPVAAIPGGNQAGITTSTIFEMYIDVDNNAATGAHLDDLGYDYKLSIDLNEWNGKSWIDGSVYWDFDASGTPKSQSGLNVYAADLLSVRWRWEFSLISLKWSHINWVARVYYHDHWAERVPDSSFATLALDTTLVPGIDTASSEFIQMIYPATFQATLDSFDVVHTVDQGARIEKALCGTDFTQKPQKIMFNPWLNGVAYSGNPIMMGSWNWGSEPQWFIFFHELGHDFTLAANRFQKLYPWGGYVGAGGDDWHFGTDFTEAWATMVGFYAMHEMFTYPSDYGIAASAATDLRQAFDGTTLNYFSELAGYETYPDHSHLFPDLLDGIFVKVADSLGYNTIRRWFLMLQPPDAPWGRLDSINASLDYTGAKVTSMTITACAFSVAAKSDLRDLFAKRWDFPIDDLLYAQVQPEIDLMINGSDDVRRSPGEKPMAFRILGNYPNPFNPATTIAFQLPQQSRVCLKIYNVLGQLVQSADIGEFGAGTHRITFDASKLSSGTYFFAVESSLGIRFGKCAFLK